MSRRSERVRRPRKGSELPELEAAGASAEPRSSLARDAAARQLVEALVARGSDTFFGVPGGPVCAVFEAIRLVPGARCIASRHESHAAFAAATYHRATGRVPVVVVTAGPGITHAVTGIASAHLERVPMLVIAGDVAWANGGRLAQDSGPEGIDAEQLLASITRAQVRVARPESAVAQTMAALDVATDPIRPGPALLVLPIDRATASAPRFEVTPPARTSTVRAPAHAVETAAEWLASARRPLIVLGGGVLPYANEARRLLDLLDVPFVTTPRAKGVVSEEHPRSLRNGGMAASMWARRYTAAGVDVTLALGTDLDDSSVGPTRYVGAGGRLVHVDLDPSVFGRNLPTALAATGDVGHFLRDLRKVVTARGLRNGRGRELMREVRSESPFDVPDAGQQAGALLSPARAVLDLERAAGDSARFITDIGEHMLFGLHYLTARGPDRFHIQLALGSMGSGIAGAIGLALADRERPVVCICGDGGMQMSGGELLLALEERLPIVFAVFNDGRYNMVHHGMKQIFGAADPWSMPPVHFADLARSMGIRSAVVDRPGQIEASHLAAMLAEGGPVLLDVRIDANVRVRGGGRVEALQHMSMGHGGGEVRR